MFAAQFYESDPLQWAELPYWIGVWFQTVGGFAALGLVLWGVLYISGGTNRSGGLTGIPRVLFLLALIGAAGSYLVLGLLRLPDGVKALSALLTGQSFFPKPLSPALQRLQDILLTSGGLSATVAVLVPFVLDGLRLRWRRIWAIAKLTILDVWRRRIVAVYALLLLVFLFGSWFIDPKPERQVYNYVEVVALATTVLVIVTTSLVASFSIPTDMRQQTIHTVVTKPVQRYEIVLGRYLGYMAVMTVALLGMTTVSLFYVERGVDEDAKFESLKARVPVYGTLEFEGTKDREKGENVGEEWDYRSYINGPMPQQPPQYAVWNLSNVPRDLGNDGPVRCEFTFAIYRTTTGEVGKGVFCAFEVQSWRWLPGRKDEYDKKRKQQGAENDNQLAQDYGYYQLPSKEVVNYHTQFIDIPAGIFKNHFATYEELKPRIDELKKMQDNGTASAVDLKELENLEQYAKASVRPPLRVRVRCISRTQFLGMARYDLYLLAREQPFWMNYYKGAIGIWFFMALVTGVAVVCSTYLSGVISWLCVGFLFTLGLGLVRDFVVKVATGTNEGGGPGEAVLRLLGRQPVAAQLDETTTTRVAVGGDELFRWTLRRFIDVLPNVSLFDFTDQVANGFNISGLQLLLTFILLLGYLLPWAVLGYYLMKSREIAGAM
jgi:ABC-type transport system involved in multi-copper enzyme maturation permease subunit